MTAAQRLDILLSWVNAGDLSHAARLRRDLAAFVRSFDGSDDAGFLEVVETSRPEHLRPAPPTDEDLSTMIAGVGALLAQGFDGDTIGDVGWTTTLTFNVRGVPRDKPRWIQRRSDPRKAREGGAAKWKDYNRGGRFVLQVSGPLTELVPFLVGHLLTRPGMVSLRQCARPGCGQFIVNDTRRGAPQKYCSRECSELHRANVKLEAKQKWRKR